MAGPAFNNCLIFIKNTLTPFVLLLFMLILQVSRWVLFYMLCMMYIGFIRIQFYAHKITQADPEVAWQRRTDFPMIALYVKVYFPSIVIIY